MGDDIAESLAKTAGIAGNEKSLKDLLVKIKDLGADDVLLVPTSADIEQLKRATEVASLFA